MVKEKKGRFSIHGSSGIITVPADMIKEKQFPLRDGYKVLLQIEGEKVVATSLPRFEHLNTYENHATIYDNKLDTELDIYFHENGIIWCDYCKSPRCEHIDYTLELEDVQKVLKEKEWTRKEP